MYSIKLKNFFHFLSFLKLYVIIYYHQVMNILIILILKFTNFIIAIINLAYIFHLLIREVCIIT